MKNSFEKVDGSAENSLEKVNKKRCKTCKWYWGDAPGFDNRNAYPICKRYAYTGERSVSPVGYCDIEREYERKGRKK